MDLTTRIYETGLFALEMDDWSPVEIEPGAEEYAGFDAAAYLASIRSLDSGGPAPTPVATLARATYLVDLVGQVQVLFHLLVPEGVGRPFYAFDPIVYLQQDRPQQTIKLIVIIADADEEDTLHTWSQTTVAEDKYMDDYGMPDAEAAFHAMMEITCDAVRITPVTDELITHWRTLPIPGGMLDTLLIQHGRYQVQHLHQA